MFNYWFSFLYKDVNIKPEQLRTVPIAYDFDKECKITKIVEDLLILNGEDKDKQLDLERDLDEIIYVLYNLTPEEIALVEESVK